MTGTCLTPVTAIGGIVIGPVQSFTLSRLSWELNPHGTTVMSVGFQVAGTLGSSLFAGAYYLNLSAGLASGADLASASSQGFLEAGIMTACFGGFAIILSIVEGNLSKKPFPQESQTWAEAENEPENIVSPVYAPGYAIEAKAKASLQAKNLRAFKDKRPDVSLSADIRCSGTAHRSGPRRQ